MFEELRKYISCIFDLCNCIADLDLIISFTQFSMRSGYTKPKFGQYMDVKNSRHPILEFINPDKPVANNIVNRWHSFIFKNIFIIYCV